MHQQQEGSVHLRALGLLACGFLGLLLVLWGLGRRASSLLIGASWRGLGSLHNGGVGGRCGSLPLAGSGLLGRLGLVLELFGDGVVVIGRSLGSGIVLDGGHGNLEIIRVFESLLVAHVLGQRVAGLVGVNAGIVETEVVLVGGVPALLLGRAHVGPPALALLLNGTFGSLSTKVIGNDGAGVLHVQEVRCERSLGGVGVMSALLALLLLLGGGNKIGGNRHHEAGSGSLERAEQIALTLGGGLTEKKVGLADVVLSEGAQKLQDGAQAANSRVSNSKEALIVDNALGNANGDWWLRNNSSSGSRIHGSRSDGDGDLFVVGLLRLARHDVGFFGGLVVWWSGGLVVWWWKLGLCSDARDGPLLVL